MKEGQRKRAKDRGGNLYYFDKSLAKVQLLAVSSGSPRRQEFSFNILSEVSVKINLASSHLPSDHVVAAAGGQRSWSSEVGYKALGSSS